MIGQEGKKEQESEALGQTLLHEGSDFGYLIHESLSNQADNNSETTMIYEFEWDPKKAKINLAKHRISFEETATVFRDPGMLSLFDPDHSEDEDRWMTLGLSSAGNLLVVCHTFIKFTRDRCLIRLISSRKASRKEAKQYAE